MPQQHTKVSRFYRNKQEKRFILDFFIKKTRKLFVVKKKVVPLHSQSSNKRLPDKNNIGIWCNGNTTDSGPVILGSSPSIPTYEKVQQMIVAPFCVIMHFILIDYVYATVHNKLTEDEGLSGKILGSFFSFIVFCIFAL